MTYQTTFNQAAANKSPFVTIVLPAHNEEIYLRDCLASLVNQDYDKRRYEIILVDNNSTDTTAEIAHSFGVQVLTEPQGPVGRVRNTGAKAAKGELLLFLDSDCVAPKGWVRYAAGRLKSEDALVLGGGYDLRRDPKPLEKYWLLDSKQGATLPKDLLGGSIAIKKTDFMKAGCFDETVTSGEDSKLSEVLKREGFNVVIDRNMSVVHLGNPTEIRSFFRRQIWHSENYFKEIKKSFKDPSFILILTFLISSALAITSVTISFELAFIATLMTASIPAIFLG